MEPARCGTWSWSYRSRHNFLIPPIDVGDIKEMLLFPEEIQDNSSRVHMGMRITMHKLRLQVGECRLRMSQSWENGLTKAIIPIPRVETIAHGTALTIKSTTA